MSLFANVNSLKDCYTLTCIEGEAPFMFFKFAESIFKEFKEASPISELFKYNFNKYTLSRVPGTAETFVMVPEIIFLMSELSKEEITIMVEKLHKLYPTQKVTAATMFALAIDLATKGVLYCGISTVNLIEALKESELVESILPLEHVSKQNNVQQMQILGVVNNNNAVKVE